MNRDLVGVLLISMSILMGCTTKEERFQSLYDDLSIFADAGVIDSDEMRRFFAEEATAEGRPPSVRTSSAG